MKRNRFIEQIIGILKEHEAGTLVSELCRSTASVMRVRSQAAEDAGGREYEAEAASGRCHARQYCFERPFGKEVVTPAAKRELTRIW